MDLGTVYVNIKSNSADVIKGFQQLGKEAKQVPIDIEKNWQVLGAASEKMFETMRQRAKNSYDRIVASAETSAKDRVKAEEALNNRLRQLDEAQFGRKFSLIETLRKNWLGITAVVLGTYYAVKKVTDAVSGVTLASARYETLGVVMEVVGRNAGYSAQEMDNFAKNLEKTGISLTESRQQLTRMAQAQIDLTKATELGRIAQDAAVIGQIDSSQAFARMIYGIQTAQPEILRNIGLTVSFEQAYKDFAKTLGKATDALTVEEKTQARVNAVMQKGKEIAGTYEASMGTASKLMGSMVRQISNMGVQIGEVFLPAFTGIMDTVYEAAKNINKYLEENKAKLEEWGRTIADVVLGTVLGVLKVLSVVWTVAEGIVNAINSLIKPFETVWNWVKKILPEVNAITEGHDAFVDSATKGLQNLTEGHDAFSATAISEVEAMGKSVLDLTRKEEDLNSELSKAPAQVTATKNEIEKVKNPVDTLIERMEKWRKEFLDGTLAAKRAAATAIAEQKALVDNAISAAEKVEESWKGAMDTITAATKGVPEPAWMKKTTDPAEMRKQLEQIRKMAEESNKASSKILKDQAAILQAYATMYDGLKDKSAEYYDVQVKQIDAQREKFEELTGDAVAAEAWANEKKKKLLDEYKMKYGSVIDMMDIQYSQYTENMMNSSQVAFEAISTGIKKLQQDFDDNLFNFLTGEFDEIEWNWEDMWHSMLRVVTRYISEMIAELVIMQRVVRPILSGLLAGSERSVISSAMGIVGSPTTSGSSSLGSLTNFLDVGSIFNAGGYTGSWGLTSPTFAAGPGMGPSAAASGGNVLWSNVLGYAATAYNVYQGMKALEDRKYLSATGTALGTGIGAFFGGPLGAGIGGSVGSLVGSFLDNIFGIGGNEPGFSLSHMQGRWSGDVGKWVEGRGLGMTYINPNETPLENWASLGTGEAIQQAYVQGRDAITTEFNTRMQGFLDSLPEEYAKNAEEALMNIDFNYLIPGGEWDVSNADQVIEQLLQGYGDFLDEVFSDIIKVVGKQYFNEDVVNSKLYGLMTAEKQAGIKDLLTGEDLTGEQLQSFLQDFSSLGAVLEDFEALIDPSIRQMTTYESLVEQVGGTFDGYIEILREAGIAVEELGDLEEMRADVIEREVRILQDNFWDSFIEEMTLAYSGMSEYEKKVYLIHKQFDEYIAQAEDLGLSEEQLAQIREWEQKAIDSLTESTDDLSESTNTASESIEDLNERLDKMIRLSNAMSMMAGGAVGDTRMSQISARYGWSAYGGQYDIGGGLYKWQNIVDTILSMNLSLKDLEYMSEITGIPVEQYLSDFEYIAQQYDQFKQVAAQLKDSLSDQTTRIGMSEVQEQLYDYMSEFDKTIESIDELFRQQILSASEAETMREQAEEILQDHIKNVLGRVQKSIQDVIDEHTLTDYEKALRQANEWYQEQADILSELKEGGYIDLATFLEQMDLLGEAWGYMIEDMIENMQNPWEDLIESLDDQIRGLMTGSASPGTINERLAIVKKSIEDYTGGLGISAYLENLGSDAERQEAIQKLMSLYNEYLSLAQEAYQLPSTEYQEIYDNVLASLAEMQSYAQSEYDYWEEQLDYLRQIAENTNPLGSYQSGVNYVPETGLYRLHQGESVIPANGNLGDIYFYLNLTGNLSAHEVRQEFEIFLRSNIGRKMMQQAARGY